MAPSNSTSTDDRAHKKRKRKASAPGASVTTVASGLTTVKSVDVRNAPSVSLSQAQFNRMLSELAATGTVVPPTVASVFYETYIDVINHFKNAQMLLQRAMVTQSKFGLATANGAYTSAPIQSAVGTMDDERVVGAKADAEAAITTACTATTTLLSTIYLVQVEKLCAQIDPISVVAAPSGALTAYANGIIERSGGDEDDLTAWDPCIAKLKAACLAELKALKFEFTARAQQDAETKEAKAAAVNNAQGARPIVLDPFSMVPDSVLHSETEATKNKARKIEYRSIRSSESIYLETQTLPESNVLRDYADGGAGIGEEVDKEGKAEGEESYLKSRRGKRCCRTRRKYHTVESQGERQSSRSNQGAHQRLVALRTADPEPKLDVESWMTSNVVSGYGLTRSLSQRCMSTSAFHLPVPDATGPTLIDELENALSKAHNQIEIKVLSQQSLLIRPNICDKDLDGILRLLANNSVLAIPADKNLGLCLVTSKWYESTAYKLLENDSYIEEDEDHVGLLLTLTMIVEKSKNLVTKQQHAWLKDPCITQPRKVPILKVLPKIHKSPISGRPIVPTFGTLLLNVSVWVDHQIKPLLEFSVDSSRLKIFLS
ncbi:hypothetical protein DFH07DRAFT_770540 [Mycena maculata]|uniref:Uncharacterized protein n=1 Tax=Mycena maculata TaxID=230809 RepID=A0AAD7JG35_9AGAR|nr:hypothetical protein DFH07DRAFT_770540 [Mycena maculata]